MTKGKKMLRIESRVETNKLPYCLYLKSNMYSNQEMTWQWPQWPLHNGKFVRVGVFSSLSASPLNNEVHDL